MSSKVGLVKVDIRVRDQDGGYGSVATGAGEVEWGEASAILG